VNDFDDDAETARFGCLVYLLALNIAISVGILLGYLIQQGSAKDGKEQINTRGSVSGSVEAEFP